MSLPKISIITPSFNQGEFIEETLRSVIEQDYPNLEYIVIDGGSRDQTIEILRRYESRITHWVSEPDTGQSQAINKGLRRATGEIASWLCSDDVYLPGALNRVARYFQEHKEVVMLHGQTILFGQGKEIIRGADPTDLQLRYFSVIPFPQPSSFFRKKLIDEQGLLREDLHYAMDYDLLVRAALHYRVLGVSDIFSKYRIHPASKTGSQLQAFAGEWIRVFSKFLRSVEGGSGYREMLEECGLYVREPDRYTHAAAFSESDIRNIVLYYLLFMAHLYYQLTNQKRALDIIAAARRIDAAFCRQHGLHQIEFRSRYLPPFLIRLLRKITHS